MNETEEGREQTRKWIKEIYEWGELHDHRRPLHLKKKKKINWFYRLLPKERGKEDVNRGKKHSREIIWNDFFLVDEHSVCV